ncbi:PREDICTED: uncharacterized protein At4g04775-like [Nicotiana attenuata]|uniref:uncharacterized protein At4g04775-like n=1 Tax=Nicotiana attenuata TaxID=49451 RepID=UPI000905439E|nr:PREDICTED: uncharacterized protein At4g04775-like [Nicotiana attenuata]
MSQSSTSSQRRCRCGIIANHFTSTTPSNPGRKFYTCARPKNNSYGYFEWEDEISTDGSQLEIRDLKSSLNAVSIERDKLREKLIDMEAMNKFEDAKVKKLEERVVQLMMVIIGSWAMFVGFFAAWIMK